MRSFFATIRDLVFPFGAQKGQPRLAIGPDLPAPLTTYNFINVVPGGPGPATAVAGIIWYIGTPADSYIYMVLATNAPFDAGIVIGSVNGGVLVELATGWPKCTVLPFAAALRVFGIMSLAPGPGGAIPSFQYDWEIQTGQANGLVSQPRGKLVAADDNTSSPAIGITETIINFGGFTSTAAFNVQAGRAYEVIVTFIPQPAAANTTTYRVRENTLTGPILFSWAETYAAAGVQPPRTVRQIVVALSDKSVTLVFTMQTSASTTTAVAGAAFPRTIEVVDIADPGGYSFAPVF